MKPDDKKPARKVWTKDDDFDEMKDAMLEEMRNLEDMIRLGNFETKKIAAYFSELAKSGTDEEKAYRRKIAGALLVSGQCREKRMADKNYKASAMEERQCKIADEWHADVTAKAANDPAVKALLEGINAYLETQLPEFADRNPAIARRIGERDQELGKKFKR